MPLYATDGENYIYAPNAIKDGSYRCLECRSPLKVRRGKNRIPHFYHIQTTSNCRLYSKSEEHLLVQLQLQNLLSPQEIRMEAPFLSINRIADLLWEKEKIVFEIQCSSIDAKESEARIKDYRKIGYEIVWLLDDRLFNRNYVKSEEFFLRSHSCYFFHFQRNRLSFFYDQLEIIVHKKRIKRSKHLRVDFKRPGKTPEIEWPSFLPQQLLHKIASSPRYFYGDLIHKAIQAPLSPFQTLYLTQWQKNEKELTNQYKIPSLIKNFLKKHILKPYINWLEELLGQIG